MSLHVELDSTSEEVELDSSYARSSQQFQRMALHAPCVSALMVT